MAYVKSLKIHANNNPLVKYNWSYVFFVFFFFKIKNLFCKVIRRQNKENIWTQGEKNKTKMHSMRCYLCHCVCQKNIVKLSWEFNMYDTYNCYQKWLMNKNEKQKFIFFISLTMKITHSYMAYHSYLFLIEGWLFKLTKYQSKNWK